MSNVILSFVNKLLVFYNNYYNNIFIMSTQIKICANRDSFIRMNYLYQASKLAANISMNTQHNESKKCADFISSYYANCLMNIGKKSVLRIAPEIKRTICKGCHCILIPGETVRVRLRQKPTKHLRWTCLKCNTYRTYNMKRDYQIWSENPEAIVEVLDYGEQEQKTNVNEIV